MYWWHLDLSYKNTPDSNAHFVVEMKIKFFPSQFNEKLQNCSVLDYSLNMIFDAV